MFEILMGDVFDRGEAMLTVFKIRIEVVAGTTRTLVHYVDGAEVRIRPAEVFATMIGEGLADGSIRNLNRPADFGQF